MFGKSPAPPQIATPAPTAADEEAAAERARLYSLLRGRRGVRSLGFGPRRRRSLIASALAPSPTTMGGLPAASFLLGGGDTSGAFSGGGGYEGSFGGAAGGFGEGGPVGASYGDPGGGY